jgi:cytochrome P450
VPWRAEAAGTLSEDEIVGNVMLLLLAGHVAVRNLVGNLLWLLLTHPEQHRLLRADLGLMHGAIEEALRFEPPVTLIPRVALTEIEFRAQSIPKGAIVQLSIAAANRDPQHVTDPDRFDITRKPMRHTSFAVGVHACLGALLAREQAKIAVETLFRRFPGLRLDPDRPIEWYRDAGNRGPIALPVRG